MTSSAFFEHVTDALSSFLPPALRTFTARRTSRNVKIWYGDRHREHYEAQFVARSALKASGLPASAPALEIGFHAEHPDAALNDEVVERITAGRKAWKPALGTTPQAGQFIGHDGPWRRVSEVWTGPELLGEESATEAADRLAAYITAFEPLRGTRP